ncbi:hypothetical protein JKP88DRAFT_312507 [Tribonema minus]|uniref:Uncharacterized protein n=1 Tax=Tribonema minus TaxID=303371 RepID=A0A835ZAG1_9STRA|nr:hypothetical protein JKP88DRAFT_312507 [Tribonema minus]
MCRIVKTVAALALTCAYTIADTTCNGAAASCGFFLGGSKDKVPVFDICSPPSQGFTGAIKSRDGKPLGNVNSDGPAMYLTKSGNFKPLTTLNDNLSATQFRPYSSKVDLKLSGSKKVKVDGAKIGHENFQQKSKPDVKGRCIKVPLSNWQVLDPATGEVRKNVQASDAWQATSCVVFKISNAKCARSLRGADVDA